MRIKVSGERQRGRIYRYFYLAEAREVLLQSGSISFSLAFIYITFRLCGGYMLHMKIQIQTDIHTQGSKIQSQQLASCPTENNQANTFWSRSFVYCMCPPSERDLLLYCFSPQLMVIYKAHLHFFYSLSPLLSYLIHASPHHNWIEKKNKEKQDNKMPICVRHHSVHKYTGLHFERICISLFPHLNLLVWVEQSFVTWW